MREPQASSNLVNGRPPRATSDHYSLPSTCTSSFVFLATHMYTWALPGRVRTGDRQEPNNTSATGKVHHKHNSKLLHHLGIGKWTCGQQHYHPLPTIPFTNPPPSASTSADSVPTPRQSHPRLPVPLLPLLAEPTPPHPPSPCRTDLLGQQRQARAAQHRTHGDGVGRLHDGGPVQGRRHHTQRARRHEAAEHEEAAVGVHFGALEAPRRGVLGQPPNRDGHQHLHRKREGGPKENGRVAVGKEAHKRRRGQVSEHNEAPHGGDQVRTRLGLSHHLASIYSLHKQVHCKPLRRGTPRVARTPARNTTGAPQQEHNTVSASSSSHAAWPSLF